MPPNPRQNTFAPGLRKKFARAYPMNHCDIIETPAGRFEYHGVSTYNSCMAGKPAVVITAYPLDESRRDEPAVHTIPDTFTFAGMDTPVHVVVSERPVVPES